MATIQRIIGPLFVGLEWSLDDRYLSPSLMIKELWIKRRQINLVRRLKEHRVHEMFMLLPAVEMRLGGEGSAAGNVPQHTGHG